MSFYMDDNKQHMSTDKYQEQEAQYQFPYHHTPHFLPDGSGMRVRDLDWGFDYLACQQHAKQTIENHKPSSVLEIGCGDGAIIGAFSREIKRLVGVDLSKRAIAFASAFFPDIEFHARDANLLSETFDAVLAVEVLEHIPDEDISSFLKVMEDRTKPGGLIYISVPSINLPLYKKHYRHYDPELLKKQIKEADLNVEIIEARFFRSPVFLENFYKRLTCNRLFVGELHPLRRFIWKKIINGLDQADNSTAQHVVAVLKKNDEV